MSALTIVESLIRNVTIIVPKRITRARITVPLDFRTVFETAHVKQCAQTVVIPVVSRRFAFVEERIPSTTSKMIVSQLPTTTTSIVSLDAVAIMRACPSVHEFTMSN